MFKHLKATAVVLSFSVIFAGTAHANVNEALQNICTIVEADDKGELRKKMKMVQSNYKLKLQDYYSGVTCGGQSLIRTAFLNNAINTGELLVKKMPKSQLNAPEQDGLTLRKWVSENNMMSSELAKVLNDRI